MVKTTLAAGASVSRRSSSHGQRAGGSLAPEDTRIGQGVVLKGEVKGDEDFVIDGRFDGTIDLSQRVLTVGPTGRVEAQLSAGTVVVLGRVNGSVQASDLVRIGDTGSIEGAISAPRLVVADGASLQGRVDV